MQDEPEVYYTIKQAASQLRVAESTVWRWVDRGVMPAYRSPGRRLRLKKADVDMAIKPTLEERRPAEWRKWVTERREEKMPVDRLLMRVAVNAKEILARRGSLLPSSVDDLRAAREEWGRRLEDA